MLSKTIIKDKLNNSQLNEDPKPLTNVIPQNVASLEKRDLQNKFYRPTNAKNDRHANLRLNCNKVETKSFWWLFKKYQGTFVWNYDELKNYDTQIIQHIIPLNPWTKSF